MEPLVPPPKRLPLFLRPLIWLSEKITGKPMMPSRLLAWTPAAALASALLELAGEGAGKKLGAKLAKMVRIRVSAASACPFCLDMNVNLWKEKGLSPEELEACLGRREPSTIPSLGEREILALEFASAVSAAPLAVPPELVLRIQEVFGPRNTVRLAVLCAKVNYWARLAQGLGIPPAGYQTEKERV